LGATTVALSGRASRPGKTPGGSRVRPCRGLPRLWVSCTREESATLPSDRLGVEEQREWRGRLLQPRCGRRLDGLKDELGRGFGLRHERDV
jgi:hypothetical protein